MRNRILWITVLLSGLISIIVASVFIETKSSFSSPEVKKPSSNVIVLENALPGTTDWQIPDGKGATIEIQAYASATSVLPGQSLTFYVSTFRSATPYSIDIYRMGWYGGRGGRLMFSLPSQISRAQGYYDPVVHRLIGCVSCLVDVKTGLVEANWLPSYTLTVPSNWITGIYLAKFTDINGMQTYIPFDVRGKSHSIYVAVTADTTYAAYNDWGGYSLYVSYTSALGKAVKVSFDRPYNGGFGASQVLDVELDAIRWLEHQGYDLSYMSSVDLHENPLQLLQHHAYLSLGHDEYWTKEMRDGVEHARDQGVGLVFLGADAAYWQMRFVPDSEGSRDRTIVCYKVLTQQRDLANDPLYGKDNSRVTSQWRDPVLARPENALIGIMYSDLTHQQRGFPWHVAPNVSSSLLEGTGLLSGQSYGCGLVGYEWDRVFKNGATPKGLVVLGETLTVDNWKYPDVSNTTYYIAPSGAMVFASGSIYWTNALDSYRFNEDKSCKSQNPVVVSIQKLLKNVMDAVIVHHAKVDLASA